MNQSFQEPTMEMDLDMTEDTSSLTKQEQRNLYRRTVRTLRRIPVPIRLDLATREFNMGEGAFCLVGTAVRASIAKMTNKSLEQIGLPWDVTGQAAEKFGGSESSWDEIYGGVCDVDQLPIIERAFVNVLLETV